MAYPLVMPYYAPTHSQLVRYYVLLGTIAMNLVFEAWKVLLHVGP